MGHCLVDSPSALNLKQFGSRTSSCLGRVFHTPHYRCKGRGYTPFCPSPVGFWWQRFLFIYSLNSAVASVDAVRWSMRSFGLPQQTRVWLSYNYLANNTHEFDIAQYCRLPVDPTQNMPQRYFVATPRYKQTSWNAKYIC